MDYFIVKHIHITTAVISISLFIWRFALLQISADQLQRKLWKVLPHINDTLLLLLGVTLAVKAGFNPIHQPWLLIKIICLLGYIFSGMYTLKKAKTKTQQWLGFGVAMLMVSFILKLAIFKSLF